MSFQWRKHNTNPDNVFLVDSYIFTYSILEALGISMKIYCKNKEKE
jgi:hypothetical protein